MIDPELQKAAEQGDADAQCEISSMYYYGTGVQMNREEAFKWCRMAAEQGPAGAQFSLGWMYKRGLGVPRNDAEAVKWFQQAAEQGHTAAQYSLGEMQEELGRNEATEDEEIQGYRTKL